MAAARVASSKSANFLKDLEQFPLNLLALRAKLGRTVQEETDLRTRI
jgi:hypothetical protein